MSSYARQYRDVLVQPLYDSAELFPGDSPRLFVEPRGQGSSVFVKGPKTGADTNMNLSGQLPAGYWFSCSGIECEALRDTPRRMLEGVVLEFIIASKPFVTLPASRASCRLTEDEIARGWMLPGMKFEHSIAKKPLDLGPTCPWYVQATSVASGVVVLRVALNGYLYRPVE